jgi:predicted TIM-barrel fold metal-dependent hydrolase
MAIVDSQIHIWRTGTATPPHLSTPYLVEDAVRDMDEAGVDAAILHPPASWDPHANEQAIEAVLAHPQRFAILGNPPLDQADSPALISNWKERAGMLGLRLYFNKPHNKNWPLDGTLDWLWPVAAKAQLPVALLAGDWLPLFGQIAARHPDLKLTVDHMGALRGGKGDAAFPNMKELTALAKYPNVAVKLTGGPFYADDAYPFTSLHKHYRRIYEAFGPQRLFWGTDITKMPCSWRQCVTHFQAIDWISEADKQLIMGDAICGWLGWQR